jgi:hypothetical protein
MAVSSAIRMLGMPEITGRLGMIENDRLIEFAEIFAH